MIKIRMQRNTQSHLTMALAYLLMIALTPGLASGKSYQAAPAPDATLSATLAKTPNEMHGKRIFEQHCAQCHQADAYGQPAQAVPALAGQQYEYLAKQLVDFLSFERDSDTMHKQLERSGLNNATAIADVVAYVSNLPMNPAPEKGDGQNVALGKKIYTDVCASCHGRSAEGNGDLWVPNLRGQHYGYLREQMRRMAHAKRANISDDLHRIFTGYSDEEFAAVADYLTRWPQQD
jgi:cytochrome c553